MSLKLMVEFSVIISTLNRLVLSHLSSKSTKSYAINAIAKLSNQQMSSEGHNLIRQNVAKYGTSMILELQQRSVEFSALFDKVSRSGPSESGRSKIPDSRRVRRIHIYFWP